MNPEGLDHPPDPEAAHSPPAGWSRRFSVLLQELARLDHRSLELPSTGDSERIRRLAAELASVADLSGGSAGLAADHKDAGLEFVERPLPGSTLGPYRLVTLLGEGGMGQVWEAWDSALERRVALKLLKSGFVGPRTIAYFEREARTSARVRHPGIVTVHAAGTIGETRFIAAELVEGGRTLSHRIEEQRRAARQKDEDYRSTALLFVKIARALQAAHDERIIHRDVKPQNILIDPFGEPKITDFGLARILDEERHTLTSEGAGTLAYMSPEQIAPTPAGLDARSDVFSLGVVLFEALTLQRPFHGDTLHQIAEQIRLTDPLDPRSIRSRIPLDLALIVGHALEKRPEHRYPSMAALADDLQRFLEDRPIVARAPSPWRRAGKWMRRHPTRTVAVALTVVAAVISSILIGMTLRANERSRLASGWREVRKLEERVPQLWPALPGNTAAIREWIASAEALVAELPRFREIRDGIGKSDADSPDYERVVEIIQALESWQNPGHGLLTAGIVPGHGWGMLRRLAEAESVAERTLTSESAVAAWERALAEIASSEVYAGVNLSPQLGLLPLGMNPEGYFEFAHLATGRPSRRIDGELRCERGDGLVLVLLPGGRIRLGSQNDDSTGSHYDPDRGNDDLPLRVVDLAPFFISKFEMTQDQWERWTGSNPSLYKDTELWPEDRSHPVESIQWHETTEQLSRLDLELPSEDQWEYAARGGSTWPWWTGPEPQQLHGAANLFCAKALEVADSSLATSADRVAQAEWFQDGYAYHAPVGSLRPNPFGLYDVLGNVWEQCKNRLDIRGKPNPGGENPFYSRRGAAFTALVTDARVTRRLLAGPEIPAYHIGVRAVRSIIER